MDWKKKISGLAPYNFICVQAGCIISELKNWRDIFDTKTVLKLTSFAFIPIAYAFFIKPVKVSDNFIIKMIKKIGFFFFFLKLLL